MSKPPADSVREKTIQWALQTAPIGEDATMILARAQLYEDHLLSPINNRGFDVSKLDRKSA
jgi:hypothetical protein